MQKENGQKKIQQKNVVSSTTTDRYKIKGC